MVAEYKNVHGDLIMRPIVKGSKIKKDRISNWADINQEYSLWHAKHNQNALKRIV